MPEYKIVDVEKLDSELRNLANKIREKKGALDALDFYAGEFTEAVGNINTSSDDANIDELVNLIDESGVLGSALGTPAEKVEQLINKTSLYNKATGI